MKMKKSILTLIMTMSLMLSLLSGCGNEKTENPQSTAQPTAVTPAPSDLPADAPTPETSSQPMIEEIIIGTTSSIERAVRDEYSYDMLASGVSEMPLVCQDTMGQYHPLLASYETEDAVTWTYTIAEGMKWSDGEEVTAEDILFTLQYDDEKNGSANLREQTGDDGTVTSAKYTGYQLSDDNRSISLTLASANVRELSNMTSFRVMPKHIYEGKDTVTEEEARVGCGPYKFEAFNREAGTISFVADPNYPAVPNAAKITYQLFGNEDTMYMALEQGDIDMVWAYSSGVAAAYQDVLAASDHVTLVNIPAANAPAVLAFNNANGPFTDSNLRKAVAGALDYDIFRTYLGSIYAENPNAGFVPPSTVGYSETEKLKTNMEAAAQYMEAAGYKKNTDGFYTDQEGQIMSFTLTHRADRVNHTDAAELIKTQLEAFGIQVTLEALDSDSYNAKTSNRFSENNITMEAALYGYTAAGMGMSNGLATIYVDGSHAVQGGCQVFDEEFTAIRDELAAAVNIEAYHAAAAELQDYYAERLPLLALYWDNMMYAYSSDYENITVDYVFGLNNVNNWFSITAK